MDELTDANNQILDNLEAIAVEAIQETYDVQERDYEERFWIQKGIEGMRYAVVHEILEKFTLIPNTLVAGEYQNLGDPNDRY